MRISISKVVGTILIVFGIIAFVYIFIFKNDQELEIQDKSKNVSDSTIELLPVQKPKEPQHLLGGKMLSAHGKVDMPVEMDVKIMSDFIKNAVTENRNVDTFYFSSNPALTEILLGKKGMSHPLIKSTHPYIGKDQYGEFILLDRWSTPYRIHLVHRNKIEVFSAGPDQIMGNADDIQWPPAEVE